MKSKESEVQPANPVVEGSGDSAKLLSLLALATGAMAMPQTSNADIVFVDLSSNPVHVGPTADPSYVINTLPGNALLSFNAHVHATAISSSKWITGGRGAGYVKMITQALILLPANPGQVWNTFKVGRNITNGGTVAFNNYYSAGPTFGGGSRGFSGKYYLFEFKDSTQGDAMRFGWILAGVSNPLGGNGPTLSIEGYAYDTTGALLGAGQVPEPTAPALLALGALVFGSKGLRKWRKNRAGGVSVNPVSPV